MSLFLLFIPLLLLVSAEQTGGANCTVNPDCGEGRCHNSTCLCPNYLSGPNCHYRRVSRSLAAGLEALYLIGIGGVGLFLMERYFNVVLELVAGLYLYGLIAVVIWCSRRPPSDPKMDVRDSSGLIGVVCFIIWLVGLIGTIISIVSIVVWDLHDANGYALY